MDNNDYHPLPLKRDIGLLYHLGSERKHIRNNHLQKEKNEVPAEYTEAKVEKRLCEPDFPTHRKEAFSFRSKSKSMWA